MLTEFDPNETAPVLQCSNASGSGTCERIENEIARSSGGEQKRFDQSNRVGGEVVERRSCRGVADYVPRRGAHRVQSKRATSLKSLTIGARFNFCLVAAVSLTVAPTGNRFRSVRNSYRIEIENVARRPLCQEQHVLMRESPSIFGIVGRRVELVPDQVISNGPTYFRGCDGESLGNQLQRLSCVRVADYQEAAPRVRSHAPQLPKHAPDSANVLFDTSLPANLPNRAIILLPEVWGGSDGCRNEPAVHVPKLVLRASLDNVEPGLG